MDAVSSQLNKLWIIHPEPPDIFRFIEQHADISEDELVATLMVDLDHRWKTTKPLKLEEYFVRLGPERFQRNSRMELVLCEFRARGLRPTAENILDYLTRFADLNEELSAHFATLAKSNRTLNELTYDFAQGSTLDSEIKSGLDTSAPKVRYELRKMLGEGAFGKVYQGFDHELERTVAIKFPNDKRLSDSKHREQYIAEARTVASLNHPNIVPVYDIVRREDGAVYIVSKFIDGTTLEERIRQSPPSFSESCNIVASVANALEHAHQNRIVHRDVKPGNILLERDTGIAYITDFGLAIKGEQAELQGRVSGTPPYMSPEQVRGENHKLDGRSDIFSLGAILYELLTGERPFEGETPHDVFIEVLHTNPPHPCSIQAAVPQELARICLKALAKNVSERYSSAASMANDLLRWRRAEKYETLDNDGFVREPNRQHPQDTEENTNAVTLASSQRPEPTAQASKNTRQSGNRAPQKVSAFSPAKVLLSAAVFLLMLAGIGGIVWNRFGKTWLASIQKSNGDSDSVEKELDPKPKRITVRLETKPANVRVTVNGQVIDIDAEKRNVQLLPGDYQLHVESDGYIPIDYPVSITSSTSLLTLPALKIPVVLKANVQDAEFYLGDAKLTPISQTSPAALSNTYALAPGEVQLNCKRSDYESQAKVVSVSLEKREFEFDLRPLGVVVNFGPTSEGIKVFENDMEVQHNVQRAGFVFAPGSHSVQIQKPGYIPQSIRFEVTSDSALVPIEAWKIEVQFSANASDATYWVDGSPLKPLQPNSSKFALAEGQAVIVAKARGYDDWQQPITISRDSLSFQFVLPVKASLSTIPDNLYQNDQIVVRVLPPMASPMEFRVGDEKIILQQGLGAMDRRVLDKDKESWNYQLLLGNERLISGSFTKAELEANGSRPTLDINVPMLDEERGRKMWFMTRPYLKIRPQESEADLTEALKYAPQLYEIYRDRAICRAEQEKFAEGEEDFQICVKHLPNDYLVQCVGGLIAVGRGDYVAARTRLDTAITLRPESSYALVLQAMLAYRLRDNQNAKSTLLDLLKSTGENDQLAFAKLILAQIAFDDGDFEIAMNYFNEAQLHQVQAGLDPSEIRANQAHGMVRYAKKVATSDNARAERLLKDAQSILLNLSVKEDNPLFVQVRMDLAEIEFSMGGFQAALQMYSYLIDQLQVENPKLLLNRALVYEKLGMAEAAEKDRQQAAKLRQQADK
ncbi:MAG: protein kinase [Planctomycetes bacterium]|nr:protein kinase [Planctomycetota bacterium]